MNKFCLVLLLLLSSCYDPGKTENVLGGYETGLPEELKGLKVYEVDVQGRQVVVGILNNSVLSTTYREGKHDKSLILVTKDKTISVSAIISENDSIIVCKK